MLLIHSVLIQLTFHFKDLATIACRNKKYEIAALYLIGIDLVLLFDVIESMLHQCQYLDLEVYNVIFTGKYLHSSHKFWAFDLIN